jgi:molybdopterin synthase sulfur carrier subunit
MPLKLVFLGRLEDLAGAAEREVSPGPLAEVLGQLAPALADALSAERIKLAVNGQVVGERAALVLRDGDELAFLPPVSGG